MSLSVHQSHLPLTHRLSSFCTRFCVIISIALVGACQQAGPKVHTQQDPAINFSNYTSYAFLKQTKNAMPEDYARHFVSAISAEMDGHGYNYSEDKPDLLINYRAKSKSELRQAGNATPFTIDEAGYYSHSQELYQGMPTTYDTTRTVLKRSAEIHIDIIDASKMQTVWQGDIAGSLSEEAMLQPEQAVRISIAKLLHKFPPRKK